MGEKPDKTYTENSNSNSKSIKNLSNILYFEKNNTLLKDISSFVNRGSNNYLKD